MPYTIPIKNNTNKKPLKENYKIRTLWGVDCMEARDATAAQLIITCYKKNIAIFFKVP